MAITVEGSFTVPADQATVWANLNDPNVLRRCITVCQTLEKTSDTHFVATARIKIGPLSTAFKGQFDLRDVDAPHACRLVGEGQGGLAGFAKGAAEIRLVAVPGGTAVNYALEANIGGRIAKVGGKLIGGMASKIVDRFFVAFTAAILPKEAAAAE